MKTPDASTFAMYIVVRESLNMSIGKTAAQCCHAVQYLMADFARCSADDNSIADGIFGNCACFCCMSEWITDGLHTKIVLGADEKEWARLLVDTDTTHRVVVTDAGLTELEPGTDTVMAFVPMRKSDRLVCLKRLQALK